jgi:hypothetical protein
VEKSERNFQVASTEIFGVPAESRFHPLRSLTCLRGEDLAEGVCFVLNFVQLNDHSHIRLVVWIKRLGGLGKSIKIAESTNQGWHRHNRH